MMSEGVRQRHLSPLIRPSRCVSSCAKFPIRARFPIEVVGRLQSGANRFTDWGESPH